MHKIMPARVESRTTLRQICDAERDRAAQALARWEQELEAAERAYVRAARRYEGCEARRAFFMLVLSSWVGKVIDTCAPRLSRWLAWDVYDRLANNESATRLDMLRAKSAYEAALWAHNSAQRVAISVCR